MPNLYLSANPTPSGTTFPGTPDGLMTLIAQYVSVLGIGGFSGINFGDTVPLAADRDKPWLETTASGSPVAWKSWNGSEWEEMVFPIPSGGTSSRPSNPVTGQTYWDTDLNIGLVWDRAAWRTMSGSPNDLKYVEAADIATAEANNPGWYRVADYYGRVIVAAGAGAGLTSRAFGDTGGSETSPHTHTLPNNTDGHTLTIAEIPPHTHTTEFDQESVDAGPNVVIDVKGSAVPDVGDTSQISGSTGGGGSHTHPITGPSGSTAPDNMQPFICAWLLRKA